MDRSSEAAARIREIDAQQDEILRQLEELERRTEMVLAEHAPSPRPVVGLAVFPAEPSRASGPNDA
ncbi:MAG: hypothetical protein WD063_13120 [Pirellulales bacterium]